MELWALQQHIRDAIAQSSNYDLTMGPLLTLSQSAHLYDDTFENADQLIETQYGQILKERYFFDPVGNFVVEVVDDAIVIIQIPGSGQAVSKYSGKNPLKLVREIAAACPTIKPEHIGRYRVTKSCSLP